MPECWLTKTIDQKLVPDDDVSRQYVKKLKAGEPVMVVIRKPRNIKFHRKLFALLNLAFENQDKYDDFEAFRKEVVMRAGFWEEHHHLSGAISYTAKSLSFATMDELEFSMVYDKVIDAIIQHFMPGTDAGELEAAVSDVLSFAA